MCCVRSFLAKFCHEVQTPSTRKNNFHAFSSHFSPETSIHPHKQQRHSLLMHAQISTITIFHRPSSSKKNNREEKNRRRRTTAIWDTTLTHLAMERRRMTIAQKRKSKVIRHISQSQLGEIWVSKLIQFLSADCWFLFQHSFAAMRVVVAGNVQEGENKSCDKDSEEQSPQAPHAGDQTTITNRIESSESRQWSMILKPVLSAAG